MALEYLKIGQICELVVDGLSLRQISKRLNVKPTTLHDFVTKNSERQKLYKEALELSASEHIDKAEAVVLSLTKDSTPAERDKAKILHNFYLWLAARRNPGVYSERFATNAVDNAKKEKKTIYVKRTGDIVEDVDDNIDKNSDYFNN